MNEPRKIVVFPREVAHRYGRGGLPMDITHTHPAYPNEQERDAALKDAWMTCCAALRRSREEDAAAKAAPRHKIA